MLGPFLLGVSRFGKKKFAGGWAEHPFYLLNFMMRNPSPSPAARLLFRTMPARLFTHGLWVMMAVECVVPFAFFAPQVFPSASPLHCSSHPLLPTTSF